MQYQSKVLYVYVYIKSIVWKGMYLYAFVCVCLHVLDTNLSV